MGEAELKIALQREGEARMRGFWEDAEAAVAARRREIEAELEALHAATDRRVQAEGTVLRNTLLFAAQARALECRLHAETALDERLLLLARQLLPELAGQNRSGLWQGLRGELPEADWAIITVHPADRALAEKAFPAARVEENSGLGGGVIAASARGAVQVDNTLNCRLLRAWPDLLPQLLAELRQRVGSDEAVDIDTAG